jgi:uncharacterized SAM-binding protein YcdF (DUF218 family)
MLANGLTYILESQSDNVSCNPVIPQAIVVLGGGVRGDAKSLADIDHLHAASFRRTQGAYQLAQQYKDLSVIVSGGSGTGVTESDLMIELLRQQGLSVKRLFKENKSTTTWESANYTGALLNSMNIKSIWIVTSALHIPRATKVFQKQGFDVCASPVDRTLIIPKWYAMLIPQMSALRKSKVALHEIAGISWYYLSGKI